MVAFDFSGTSIRPRNPDRRIISPGGKPDESIQTRSMPRVSFFTIAAATPFLANYHRLAAAEKKRVKIRDVKVMILNGARTYTLIKIISDDGFVRNRRGVRNSGGWSKGAVLSLKPWLVGKDPLEIDKLYVTMGEGTAQLSGTRTDGSAHNLMRRGQRGRDGAVGPGGKILGAPTTTLLGGKFRDKVRVYDHSGPSNPLDKAACKAWADKVKAHPSGFTAHKFGIPRTRNDSEADPSNRVLSTKAWSTPGRI